MLPRGRRCDIPYLCLNISESRTVPRQHDLCADPLLFTLPANIAAVGTHGRPTVCLSACVSVGVRNIKCCQCDFRSPWGCICIRLAGRPPPHPRGVNLAAAYRFSERWRGVENRNISSGACLEKDKRLDMESDECHRSPETDSLSNVNAVYANKHAF